MFLYLFTACALDATPSVDENLARLDALQIVTVGVLVNHAAEGANSCYGECPDYDPGAAAAEQEVQAARLQELVTVAEAAATVQAEAAACTDEAIAANLADLKALDIVRFGALIEAVPENNPSCYSLACEADIAAAEAITCQRATALAQLTTDASHL